jgi:hypothetical protein
MEQEGQMSEKKGPFNAAIATLENNRCAFNKKAQVEITNAIRVLEAAGKVDRANALESLKDAIENGEGGTENYIRGLVESRALLESLPEKEKKG